MIERERRGARRSARRRAALWLGLGLGLLLCASCSPGAAPTEGSETHFLKSCDGGCPKGATCVCGVCTTSCGSAAECSLHGGQASCVSVAPRVAAQRCAEATTTTICDAECVQATDCAWLGPDFACKSGYCRTGSVSGEPSRTDCRPSNVTAQDVAVLGDVLIELSTFTAELEQQAQSAGLLAVGAHYRNYAAAGTSFLAAGPLSIATQYAEARAERPVRVVVMNGGATDMLNDACASDPTPACPAAQAAVRGAELLFEELAADGVEHVVYFFYPDATKNDSLKSGIDTLRPLVQNVCGKSPVACHWLDLRPIFAGHPDYLVGADGIVFGDAGAQAAATAVFQLMTARCIAQ